MAADTHTTLSYDVDADGAAYERLAAIDPPALRALIEDLEESSAEHRDLASRDSSVMTAQRASRAARRVEAAHAALAGIEQAT